MPDLCRSHESNDQQNEEPEDPQLGQEQPAGNVSSSEAHSTDLLRELWVEERLLLDQLIRHRVENRRMRQNTVVSALLTNLLAEAEGDRELLTLVEARNELQLRIAGLQNSSVGPLSDRQRNLLLWFQQQRRSTEVGSMNPPAEVSSSGHSFVTESASSTHSQISWERTGSRVQGDPQVEPPQVVSSSATASSSLVPTQEVKSDDSMDQGRRRSTRQKRSAEKDTEDKKQPAREQKKGRTNDHIL